MQAMLADEAPLAHRTSMSVGPVAVSASWRSRRAFVSCEQLLDSPQHRDWD